MSALLFGACFPGPIAIDDTVGDVASDATTDDTSVVGDTTAEVETTTDTEVATEVPDADAVDSDGTTAVETDVAPPECEGVEPCDDGDKCTTADACSAGRCVGTPVVCTAIDQCHIVGVCNPDTGACSNPSKDDDTPCDDGDVCGVEDVCRVGVCAPGRVPDDTAGDRAVGFSGDGDVYLMDMISDLDGDLLLLLLVEGPTVRQDTADGETFWVHDMPVGASWSVVLVEMDADDFDARPPVVLAHTADSFAMDALRGLAVLVDGSLVVSGHFHAEFTLGSDTPMGVSPSGFAIDDGAYVARLNRDGHVYWQRQYFGVPRADGGDIGNPTIDIDGSGRVLHSIAVLDSQLLEIVADGVTEQTFLPRSVGYSYVEEIALGGDASAVAFVRTTSSPGQTFVVAPRFSPRGYRIFGGTFAGGIIEVVRSWEDAAASPIPTGATLSPEAWLLELDHESEVLEYRHFWSDVGGEGVVPFVLHVDERLHVGLLVDGDLQSRTSSAVVHELDTDAVPGTLSGVIATLEDDTFAVASMLTTRHEALMSRLASDPRGGLILSAYFEDRFEPAPSVGTVSVAEDLSRHGLVLAGVNAAGAASFAVSLARPTAEHQSFVEVYSSLPTIVTPAGAIIIAGDTKSGPEVGVTAKLPATTSTDEVVFVLRLNSEGALACPTTAP